MSGFSTRAIHDGQAPDPTTGAVIPPLYLSTNFEQLDVNVLRAGYEYSRCDNPTRTALQELLASLEEATHAYSFASGMAAEDVLLRVLLEPGSHIIMGADAYGGTFRLIQETYARWGVTHSIVNLSQEDIVSAELAAHPGSVLWIETPTNPMLDVYDIGLLSELAHHNGGIVVVDNTFATPYLQRPFALGADVVVHSTTKYLGGHSDVIGGAVIVNDAPLAERIAEAQNALGAISSPFDCYMTIRGIKTLAVRMDRHCSNALAVAQALKDHPAVAEVIYPGLTTHPQHLLAKKQMANFGGMVSIRLTGGEYAARALQTKTRVFTLAESLGGVESLIEYPAGMTHQYLRETHLAVSPDLVRLSIGIEDREDLIADLVQALDQIS